MRVFTEYSNTRYVWLYSFGKEQYKLELEYADDKWTWRVNKTRGVCYTYIGAIFSAHAQLPPKLRIYFTPYEGVGAQRVEEKATASGTILSFFYKDGIIYTLEVDRWGRHIKSSYSRNGDRIDAAYFHDRRRKGMI